MIRIVRKGTTFIFDLIGSYGYERCSLQVNSSREATAAKKPTTAETLTATGTARNVGNNSKRRGLNSSREGSRDSVRRRGSTADLTAEQETTGTPGDVKNSRDAYNRRGATAGTPEK
jgi:hypothetical protein